MEYRKIGQTDLKASVIGTGGYPFGPPLLDQVQSAQVIEKAYEMGINFLTHLMYTAKSRGRDSRTSKR